MTEFDKDFTHSSSWAKRKISFPSNFGKNQPSPSIPLPSEREGLPHHPEQISNLSVRIEIPKQVRNDSYAQLSPRERVKLSLSRWRKDTISREGSSFFQSTLSLNPSPIGGGRITTSHWAKRKISNLSVRDSETSSEWQLRTTLSEGESEIVFEPLAKRYNFKRGFFIFSIWPSPSIPLPSEREGLPHHTELSEKSVLSTVLKNPTLSLNPSPIGEGGITTTYRTNFLSNGNSLHNYFR